MDIFDAIQRVSLVDVRSILKRKPDAVNYVSRESGLTPFITSANKGTVEVCKYLMGKGANIFVIENGVQKRNALHYACIKNHFEVVKFLIKIGFDVNQPAAGNLYPIHYAAQNSSLECISMLLKYGADVNSLTKDRLTPLHYAVQAGNIDTIRYLLKKGADPSTMDVNGLRAANYTNSDKICDLLGGKSNPIKESNNMTRIVTSDYKTALEYIEQGESYKFKQLCLSKPQIVTEVGEDGYTLFHHAIKNQRIRHTEFIFNKIKKYNIPLENDGRIPIHIALETQNRDIIELLEPVSDMNHCDSSGESPAQLRDRLKNPQYKQFNTVLKLLKDRNLEEMEAYIRGTSIPLEAREDGITLVHWAAISNQPEAIVILSNQHADINAQNWEGNTPMHFAAKYNNYKCIEKLLDCEADPTITNTLNLTPLQIAGGVNASEALSTLKNYCPQYTEIYSNFPESAAEMNKQKSVNNDNVKTLNSTLNSGLNDSDQSASYTEYSDSEVALSNSKGALKNGDMKKQHGMKTSRNRDKNNSSKKSDAVRTNKKEGFVQIYDSKMLNNKYYSDNTQSSDSQKGDLNLNLHSRQKKKLYKRGLMNSRNEEKPRAQTERMKRIINAFTSKKNSNNLLFPAIIDGSLSTVEKLIEEKADVNEKTDYGTPLIVAVIFDKVEIVRRLLEADAYANGADLKGNVPFAVCIREGFSQCLKLLCEYGSNVDMNVDGYSPFFKLIERKAKDMAEILVEFEADAMSQNLEGRTPLAEALFLNYTDMARIISKRPTDINWMLNNETIIHIAVRLGDGDLVNNLLQQGANAIIPYKNGKLPFHFAVEEKKSDVVSAFMNNGFNIDETDEDGQTMLYHYSLAESTDIIRLLIIKGASMSIVAHNGVPLLSAVINEKKVEIAKILIESDAPLELCDGDGNYPIHTAAYIGSTSLLRLIIKKNAPINAQNKFQETALIVALKAGQVASSLFLINHGTNINLADEDLSTPLHIAVTMNMEDIVNTLLSKEVPFDIKDKNGNTPLLLALKAKNLNIAINFFNRGADIFKAKDNDGVTPLHLAAANGLSSFVSLLIEKGVNVDPYSEKECTPLFVALKYKHVPISFQLLEQTANITIIDKSGKTLMHLAAEIGNIQLAEKLEEKGASFDMPDSQGVTPIMTSLKFKNNTIAQFLFSKGVNILAKDNDDVSVMHYAAISAKQDFLQNLVDNGADIHTLDKNGHSPLFLAVESSNIPVIQFLIKKGAKTSIRDKENRSLLWFAARSKSMRVLDIILSSGIDPNSFGTDSSNTPLIDVIAGGTVTSAEVLLNHGSDVNGRGIKGTTPLHWCAANQNKVPTAKMLVQKGALINARDDYGNTPLHCACDNCVVDMVEYLVENGADVNAMNHNKEAPLTYALDREKKAIVGILLERGAKLTPENFVWCCASGFIDIVETLLKRGIDPNSKDKDGYCGLSFAVDSDNFALLSLLLKYGASINIASKTGRSPLFFIEKDTNPEIIKALVRCASIQEKLSKINQRELIRISKFVPNQIKNKILMIPNLLAESELFRHSSIHVINSKKNNHHEPNEHDEVFDEDNNNITPEPTDEGLVVATTDTANSFNI